MQLALIVIAVVLVGGTAIAVIWWRLADKFFPGTAAKTGQGLARPKPDRKAGAVVIKGFDAPDRTGQG
jgi:hypothetical protein